MKYHLPIATLAAFVSTAPAAIILQPDTLLAADRTNSMLRLLDAQTGQQLGSVSLAANPSRTLEGVTLVGADAYVSFASIAQPSQRQISRVNLQTGALTQIAAATQPMGLTRRDNTLVSLGMNSSTFYIVQRFTTTGSLQSSTTLSTFPILGIGEQIDDIAWNGTSYVTVSNFRVFPQSSAFYVMKWDPTTGQIQPPIEAYFYTQPNFYAEGFDVSPVDGHYWMSFNPSPLSAGLPYIERINPTTFEHTMLPLPNTGAISDLVYVTIPAPHLLALPLAGVLLTLRRR